MVWGLGILPHVSPIFVLTGMRIYSGLGSLLMPPQIMALDQSQLPTNTLLLPFQQEFLTGEWDHWRNKLTDKMKLQSKQFKNRGNFEPMKILVFSVSRKIRKNSLLGTETMEQVLKKQEFRTLSKILRRQEQVMLGACYIVTLLYISTLTQK